MYNETITTILNHRSIRKFKPIPLTENQIHLIVQSAQKASTSSYMMAYTMIGITDPVLKEKLSSISGQSYVKENGHLIIFCADLHRHTYKATDDEYTQMLDNLENSEHLLVASIDAALAAQNAAICAESMGLGICYIGSIRNNISKVDELLSLPKHVIPLFGMVFGVPDAAPDPKPRLPKAAVYVENQYVEHEEELDRFNQTIEDYYATRQSNNRKDQWTDQMIRRLTRPTRMDVTDLLRNKGFNHK